MTMTLPPETASETVPEIWFDAEKRRIGLRAAAAKKLWKIVAAAPPAQPLSGVEAGFQLENGVQYVSFNVARTFAESLRSIALSRPLESHERERHKELNAQLLRATHALADAALSSMDALPTDPADVAELYQTYSSQPLE